MRDPYQDFRLSYTARLRALRARNQMEVIRTVAPPAPLDYEAVLTRWWGTLAPASRNHPWQIATIMAAAFPGEKPASRIVGQALQRLGWSRKRNWKNEGLNHRLWIPPTQP